MQIVIPLEGRVRTVIRSSFVAAKRLAESQYTLSSDNFQMTVQAGHSGQEGGLRLHRRREGICVDERRSGDAARYRYGCCRAQQVRREWLPGQGSQFYVRMGKSQGHGLGHN